MQVSLLVAPEFEFMQPRCVARRFFRLAPLFEHSRCNAFEFVDLFLGLRVGDEFESMSVGIEKINRPEQAVINRTLDLDSGSLDAILECK